MVEAAPSRAVAGSPRRAPSRRERSAISPSGKTTHHRRNARGRTSDPGGVATDGVFPITCQMDANGNQGIDAAARWMWYQPPGFTTEQAFTNNASNATKTYLIFRVKAADIPIEPVK